MIWKGLRFALARFVHGMGADLADGDGDLLPFLAAVQEVPPKLVDLLEVASLLQLPELLGLGA